jgi:plastocyanin
MVIDVDLTLDPAGLLAPGSAGGFRPLSATVARGSYVRFVNSDGFPHTVTSIAGATFPLTSPFDASALTMGGDRLSTGFSSGLLAAGSASQPLLADSPGTYLYGCFFHYAAPMRAEIIVQ